MTAIDLVNDLLLVTASIIKTEVELVSAALALRSLLAAMLLEMVSMLSHGSFHRVISS